jgi:hypothetical protein
LALLANAHVGVGSTINRATALDDAIAVHVVADYVHVRQIYTARAARVGGAHADPITVVTKVVVEHLVKPLIPYRPSARRPYNDHRTLLGILLWVARTDSSWRQMPEEFGKWTTAHRRYELWVKRGLWARILGALGEDGLTVPVTKKSDQLML